MKLLSSILASALVFHLVHSIVIKINPIHVQVRPSHAMNITSSAAPLESNSSAQLQITTNRETSKESFGFGSITQYQTTTNGIATDQSFGIGSNAKYPIPTDRIVTRPPSRKECNTKHKIPTDSMDLQQTFGNKSTNQSVTEQSLGNNIRAQYSKITHEVVTRQPFGSESGIWDITDKIATKGNTFEHSAYNHTNLVANATSKSPEAGLPCKIDYPVSSSTSKEESISQNGTNEAISQTAQTVESTLTVRNEANYENTTGHQTVSSSLTTPKYSHTGSTNFSSSVSHKADINRVFIIDDSIIVDSEVQISAPQTVKTATPHSDSNTDFKKGEEPLELGLTILQNSKKSGSDYETNQEVSEKTFSPAAPASKSSSNFVTHPEAKENTKNDRKIQTNISLEGEEDQIVSTIGSYSFQENAGISFTAQYKIFNASSEANYNPSTQKKSNTFTDKTTNLIQESYRLDQFKQTSSTENISVTAKPTPAEIESTTLVKSSSEDQSQENSNQFSATITIPQISATNTSESHTTASHRLSESSQATGFIPDRLSSPEATSNTSQTEFNVTQSTCKIIYTNHSSSSNPYTCKTVLVQRTSTYRSLTDEEKKARRLTISNKNPDLAKKLTRVTPLKGNISSNAGFVMVNRKYGARLFFWFVRSLHNSTQAPVIVWLQGQPGWSSLIGLFEEHGPYKVVETESGIRFELREYAWTNEFNVLYLDHCIGCGYSTAMRKAAYEPTYEMVGANVYQALVQFFGVFSEYADNDVYLAGEHGCAKYIPIIADTIHSKNAIQQEQINLRGVLIGGPYIDALSMSSYSEYLYMIGLIDEQENENLYIKEQYAKSLILAAKYNETIEYLKRNLYTKFERAGYQRLYDLRYEKPIDDKYTFERYMQKVVKYEPFVSSIHAEGLQFRMRSELLIEEIMKPVDKVLTTILQHYKVLYYNGQFDMLTPYSLTAQYFSKVKWAQTDLFYSSQLNNWHATNEGFPDGYWKFSSNLTHVVIRDAGHTVGTTKPKALFYLLRWFVNDMFEISYAPPSPDQRYLNVFI